MAQALSWLVLLCSLRTFLRGVSSLSADCSLDCQSQCPIDCRQGHYYTAGNCLECPAGFYCPGGRAAPRKCPLGTANELTAQGNISACQVCPQGYLSLESRAGCRPCPQGHACDPGTGTQRSCGPGQHSPEGQLGCRECPEGLVCPDGRSTQHCSAGQQPNPARTLCVPCSPASLPAEDTRPCQPCPAGHFCPDGLEVPPCPAGSFKPKEGVPRASSSSSCLPGAGLCLKCPAGYFCPAGASFPVPCQPGTHNPLPGQDEAADCRACPAGRACTQAGLAQPDTECSAGYVCPTGSASPHAPRNACPPGTAGNHEGLFDKAQCEPCPAGFVCARGTGGQQKPPSPCPVGHYCPAGTGPPAPLRCAPGTWSNRSSLASARECSRCPAGWFCPGGAPGPSGRCSSGHYCPPGSWRSTQFPCPAGTFSPGLGRARLQDCSACPAGAFCPPGTSKPQLCPRGSFRSGPGAGLAADCTPCPGGQHCPELGTVTPRACGAGSFSEPGSAACLPCRAGHFCARENTSLELMLAMVCPAGLLCPRGQARVPDAAANACPRGHFCPQGAAAQPCPNGTYSEQRGLGSAAGCSPCPAGKFCYTDGTENSSGIPHPTGDCPAGYLCPPGTGFPFSFPCMPGSFWDNSSTRGQGVCKPSPAGHFCDSPGLTEPKLCPAGFYCAEGSSKPEPCPEGTFGDRQGLPGLSGCRPCARGSFCAAPGQTGPSGPCEAGFYCQGGALTPWPTDGVTGAVCPAGSYCPPGSAFPIPCPPGTFSNTSGLRSLQECLDCPPGLYCAGTNNQAPSGPCEPGYFCTGGAKSALQHMVVEGHYSLAGAFKAEPCPLGTFQPGPAQSLCRSCPEGTFCPEPGLAAPQDCPKGHFCLAGSSVPLPCPMGSYSDVERAGSCKPCPAGMFCSRAGLPEPEGHCQPGHYCTQGSSTSSPVGLPFGDLCPQGHYCPAGTRHPKAMPCPAGTWNGQRGAQDGTWCLPCAPGFFCNMSGQDAPGGLCARGYYCTGRTKTAKPEDGVTGNLCPRGHFCPAGSAAPSPCPSGEYSNATGQDKCLPCPAGFHCSEGLRRRCPPGFYCPQKTGISFYPCPPGTYNPSYGLSHAERCRQCPAGMFCGEWGLSSPSGPCWPGFFCTAGASVPNPSGATNTSSGGPCPPGHFCPAGTSIPQPCPVGTYSDRLHNGQDSSCTECPPGHFCGSPGLTAPSGPCSPGYFCQPGASSPSPPGVWQRGGPCPVSHFCPEGTSSPLPCHAGTYNNLSRQAACSPCAAGYFCPENTTSYSTNPCPAGFYCPKGTRFATEFPCPRGYYNPDPMSQSLDSCLPCPPGHYCGQEGLTAASGRCDPGWFCISAAWTSQPFDLDNYTSANCLCPATATGGKCTAGFYCPQGSPEPLPCPPGLFCNASGLPVPSGECAAGFYCAGGAAGPRPTDGVTGNICPAGSYCTAASAAPQPCPAGTFSSLPGRRALSECQPCPSGFYCEEPGLSAPSGECWEGFYCDSQQGPLIDVTLYPCPRGFYCPAGTSSSSQHSCPAGTFGARQRLKSLQECQRCPAGKYCEWPGLAAPTGDCAEGFWCRSGARVRNPQDGESGLPCPAGHYCPEGAPVPLQCPPGTWSDQEGRRSVQECQPCPGGHFCNGSGQRAPSGHCSPGFYCASGAQTPTPSDGLSGAPCPLGHFCPQGSSSPVPCPPGSHVPHSRGEQCQACPEGHYCVSGEEPQPCPQGYFCPQGTALPVACPAGSYNPSLSQSSCLLCPEGFFCPKNSSSILENECPPGHFCPAGTASAAQFPCPRGTYNPQPGSSLSSHCSPCEPGHFCALPGQSQVTGPCLAGFYCSGGAASPTPRDAVVGDMCPQGSYCPQGSASPLPCPPGHYSSSAGNTGILDCLLCDAGYFCNGTGLVSPTGLCEAGFYCTAGSLSPRPPRPTASGGPCPPGHFCEEGSSRAQPCPAGTYSPSWSGTQCLECPEGFYCTSAPSNYTDCAPGPGAQTPELCPAGHFCLPGTTFSTDHPCPKGTFGPRPGATSESDCEPCPAGMYCSAPGLAQPSGFCYPGYHCARGATSPAPFKHRVDSSSPALPGNDICPMGHFCPRGTGHPVPCPPGSLSSALGLGAEEQCQPCPAGRVCSGPGLAELAQTSLCDPGYVCLEGNSAPCPSDGIHGYRCPSGSYCPAGSGLELPCEPGTFSPLPGASSCLPCPPGMSCGSAGTVQPLTCPRGYFCPGRTAVPVPCPEGTLSPLEGALAPTACRQCPVGRYCRGEANWEPDGLCSAGYFCHGGATDATPRGTAGFPLSGPCPPGHYCPQGTPFPVPCPAGTLNNASGGGSRDSCVPCSPGAFCASVGLSSPTGPCSEGFYCPANFSSISPTAFLCPKGHFCAAGSALPRPCPAGQYQPATGSASCIPCHRGFYCQEKVVGDPRLCPPHSYCPPGTRVPLTCPEGTFTPENVTGLWNEKECLPCLPGHYCRHGKLGGKCAAGYFCLAGSSQAAPQGLPFSWRFLAGCRWGQVCAGLCPAGHYCLEGSEVPSPCPANTLRALPGAGRREDCLPCPPGQWCKAGDSEAHPCPLGHYCFGSNGSAQGSVLAPQECPPHTFRGHLGARSLAECQPCPPGYHCPLPGLTSFEDYPCPPGYWCPGKGDTFLCPAGTSRIQPGAKSLEECDPCSPGYHCPDPAQTGLPNTQGIPCKPGYECPAGSVNPKPCRPGSYCAAVTGEPPLCPAGYHCPEGSWTYSSPEQLCVFPYFCPPGSAHPVPCAGGHMALSLPGPRGSAERFCRVCAAGTFRSEPQISEPCQPCPAGFTCPPGSDSYHQQPCPRGHYCPALSPAPLPCPPGTHRSSSSAKHPGDCQACPAGTFNHLPAQAACFPCGSSSSSQPGATSCTCHGLNRAFQQSDASCICQAGYVYYDERGKKDPDSNSDQDCQPQVDELCAPGQVRLASTRRCAAPERHDCAPACGPAGGELHAQLGICHCKQYISAEELCDQLCLLRAPRISLGFGPHRELLLRVDEGQVREVSNVLGPDEHVQSSQRVHLVLFSPQGVLGFIVSSTEVLDAFLMGDFSSDQLLQKGRKAQSSSPRESQALPLIPNPVVCLEAGDTILFQLSINSQERASSHYPVYQKQHLYNNNPGWDFGPFRRLDHLIQETQLNISWFAHVFLEPGTFVFRDSSAQERFLIVTVKEANVSCDPRDGSFQPSSLFQLARHGVWKQRDLNLAPNWAAITAILFILGFLVLLLTTLAIVFQPAGPQISPLKSWKPRWRSLGEPHIPPEYILLKDSLKFYEMLGPRGSGEDAGSGEKGAVPSAEHSFTPRLLEDFSVRTLYDKLEDQNLHLASQLAKHRMDVLVFHKGISQRIQSLMDTVQALDWEALKTSRQGICGQEAAEQSWAAVGAELRDGQRNNNFQPGAPWQEVTELVRALEVLLGNPPERSRAADPEEELKTQAQAAVGAVPPLHSLASEEKPEGQDPELTQLWELFSRKDAFSSLPGHEEHGLDLQLVYLSELEVEGLVAASPLAKTLCESKEALVNLQQPSALGNSDSKHQASLGSSGLF